MTSSGASIVIPSVTVIPSLVVSNFFDALWYNSTPPFPKNFAIVSWLLSPPEVALICKLSLPTLASKYLLPLIKETRGNPIHAEGGALTYFRRYCELGILGQNAGIPDNDGDFANPTPEKVTPINKNKNVGMPLVLDEDTKQYYLKKVGDLIVKDNEQYNTLADALYLEFDFDRNTNLSQNITKPKHVTFIEEWLTANQ